MGYAKLWGVGVGVRICWLISRGYYPRRIPHLWAESIFKGRGGAGFYTPPPSFIPPTPRRVFSGVGGGVYKS